MRSLGCAIENEDICTFVAKPEDCRAASSACTENKRFGSSERQSLFERANDPGDVCIEAVELAVLGAQDGIAGANLG